jgi:hypothetical protein
VVSVLVSFVSVQGRSPGAGLDRHAQLADCTDLVRTGIHRLGKRVGGNPSRVRISYPPPALTSQNLRASLSLGLALCRAGLSAARRTVHPASSDTQNRRGIGHWFRRSQ